MTRVYEFAKKVNLTSSEILRVLHDSGFEVKSHMAVLSNEEMALLESKFRKKESTTLETKATVQKDQKRVDEQTQVLNIVAEPEEFESVEEDSFDIEDELVDDLGFEVGADSEALGVVGKLRKVLRTAGVVRKQKKRRRGRNTQSYSDRDNDGSFSQKVSHPENLVVDVTSPVFVSDLARLLSWSPSQMVSFFVKRGKFLSMNDVVPKEVLSNFSEELGIIISDSSAKEAAGKLPTIKKEIVAKNLIARPPVVVVLGHVDHGKTTLIDYIRKTNVAAKEAGGITQTVRICYANSSAGEMVVIDTPGHEAFTSMRKVGAKITDIAIIIVAADDGIKPQTIESIAVAKEMGATIVVAVNKIDKEGAINNLDKIKQQLAQHDVLVEEWGGDVPCVPISAKTGSGVDDLLEIVMLQAQLLDLKTSEAVPAKAFVLESFVERGLGSCAVVLVKEGVFVVGDHVVSGNDVGKIKAIIDLEGKRVQKLGAYKAAKIVGLSAVAKTGELLEVVSSAEIIGMKKSLHDAASEAQKSFSTSSSEFSEHCINVVLKADGFGVLEALEKIILSLQERDDKFMGMIRIVAASVGNIYEKDVLLAIDNGAIILGMNVAVEKNAADLIRLQKIVVKTESIVYRLVEEVERLVISKLREVKELKLTGRGFVKKVFDIKGRIIAGCGVTEGYFADKAVVHCIRNNVKVGEGRVVSLQQNKKIVKDVHSGNECGFVCQGFTAWQEGDRVVCYAEVSVVE